MKIDKNASINEKALEMFDQKTLKILETKGQQMDVEIKKAQYELDEIISTGFSHDGLIEAKVDGNHQVLEIKINPTYTSWANEPLKSCELIAEAINDAIYRVNYMVESKISDIQYKYIAEVVQKSGLLDN